MARQRGVSILLRELSIYKHIKRKSKSIESNFYESERKKIYITMIKKDKKTCDTTTTTMTTKSTHL